MFFTGFESVLQNERQIARKRIEEDIIIETMVLLDFVTINHTLKSIHLCGDKCKNAPNFLIMC